MGFQICAIGISYKTPFCRAGHNYNPSKCLPSVKESAYLTLVHHSLEFVWDPNNNNNKVMGR